MRKIVFSLVSVFLVSLSYAQALEMSKIIPVNPATVVDELRVYGTASTDASSIGSMNIGLPFEETDSLKPFQMQTLKADNLMLYSSGTISASRDLFVNTPIVIFSNINIDDSTSFYTKISSFPVVQAGLLRAKTITGPTSNKMFLQGSSNGKVSGRTVIVDGATFDNPFNKGNVIVKRNILLFGQPLTGDNESKQAKQHIYLPWSQVSPTEPSVSPRCNTTGICSVIKCDECNVNNASYCYDVRQRTLPAVYNAKGATYTKIGTIKLYCRPNDTFDQTSILRPLTSSTCEQYMIFASRDGVYGEGFTTGDNATITTSPLSSFTISTSANLATMSKDAGEKCFIKCNDVNGCSDASETIVLIDGQGNVVDFSDFASSDFCENAKYANTDTHHWSEGSGLSCKASEKTFDIYSLRCYSGSGERLRAQGTYYQKRKVLCKKYDKVHAEYDAAYETMSASYAKDYFYPSFQISLAREYGDLSAITEMISLGSHTTTSANGR